MITAPSGPEAPGGLGLYVHWPYCRRICPYCDFNVRRDRNQAEEKARLESAILRDLKAHARLLEERRLVSIFLGGGTPSLMRPAFVGTLIELAGELWPPSEDLEVTLEANPADADRLEAFAQVGVNRLSLGVQSLNDEDLRFLGRDHDEASARRAARLARGLFANFSIDLIYALPAQQGGAWRRSLAEALDLGADHVSAYQLTIEPGAAFARQVARGSFAPVDDDLAADLFEITQEVLDSAGLLAYEVSNHAGPGRRCRHNLHCWRGGEYAGLGPGAHGRLTLGGGRWASLAPKGVSDYVRLLASTNFGSERQPLTSRQAAMERLIMGLRTSEGLSSAELAPLAISASVLERLGTHGHGLVEHRGGRLVVTGKGKLLTDRIILELAGGGED
ncbi:MAG: radical SAM family heme chaperone HemW [Caulobacteraceae bacterium]